MDKLHIELWKTRNDKRFGERCVQALVRDAIAVEHNPVTVFDGEGFFLRRSQGAKRAQGSQAEEGIGFHAAKLANPAAVAIGF